MFKFYIVSCIFLYFLGSFPECFEREWGNWEEGSQGTVLSWVSPLGECCFAAGGCRGDWAIGRQSPCSPCDSWPVCPFSLLTSKPISSVLNFPGKTHKEDTLDPWHLESVRLQVLTPRPAAEIVHVVCTYQTAQVWPGGQRSMVTSRPPWPYSNCCWAWRGKGEMVLADAL